MSEVADRKRYEAALRYWQEQARSLIEAIDEAERITAADLAIRITPIPDQGDTNGA
jgi:hypothetical protein